METAADTRRANRTATPCCRELLDAVSQPRGTTPTTSRPSVLAPIDHLHRSDRPPRCTSRPRRGSPPTTSCSTSAAASAVQPAPWRPTSAANSSASTSPARSVEVAAELNRRSGLDDLIEIRVGDAIELPCEDAEFTVSWTQHASMNIRRKAPDVRRDAQSAGRRWPAGVLRRVRRRASVPPISRCRGQTTRVRACLATPSKSTRRLVTDAGFEIRQWDDVTKSAADYVDRADPDDGAAEWARHPSRRPGHGRPRRRARSQHRRAPRHVRPVRRRRRVSIDLTRSLAALALSVRSSSKQWPPADRSISADRPAKPDRSATGGSGRSLCPPNPPPRMA